MLDAERERLRVLVLALVRSAAGYPGRWTDELTCHGDFEGRAQSIELFSVPVSEQRGLRCRLRDVRKLAEALLGGPLVLIFHTPEATAKHYEHVVLA
ncbi:MAG: hypothetical protein A3I00_08050 [Betaproteobacteria bacterium RIFCSPLOWO2_02_FULL_64_12]|nr:MAG: hypothetical protein A3I00_08050 [Betaproteobacteria bacterium RIFCSPLOWO2_02_FULL_64_12]